VECSWTSAGLASRQTTNAYIEAFNAQLRQECLNENWFLSVEDARQKVEAWRRHYNTEQPHGSLGYMVTEPFAVAKGCLKSDHAVSLRSRMRLIAR
jgi:transposase InsO family protein